ncbi:hypothetical protein [Desulfoluna spongiiphila]|uniref:Gp5/Type VI secretion system Vgr protein OB-fold domain-containing protein n=1 Tax=Desulfoluna spongiiphila TaxID=419481 RepID=A0A1G5JK39_9BACT|nr:hypothetical protein [Desulfoluna spongiiphila]SCY88261.1 hypothetical protein SAMN05216233_13210 [Desulfoluna spongiiphila]VVS92751.1 hypothetical protein DBB_23190 [Desulfoluna spongiiphila]
MTVSNVDDFFRLFQKAVELVRPNLRKFYRVVRKAEVVRSYPSDGQYWADVQPLLNDETPDPDEPVIPKVEIPVLWAGPERGVVCPPAPGTRCDLSYYDGDPNFPRIGNFRWQGNKAPQCDLGAFIIQLEPGVSIEIEADKRIVTLTSASAETEAGDKWTVKAGSEATVDAPLIKLNQGTGVVTGACICHFTGLPHGDVSSTVFAGK